MIIKNVYESSYTQLNFMKLSNKELPVETGMIFVQHFIVLKSTFRNYFPSSNPANTGYVEVTNAIYVL